MNLLVYTFRTFPYKERLDFSKLFVFGKLKEDFARFSRLLKEKQPDYVLGVAKAEKGESRVESIAINQFSQNRKINKNGLECYLLDTSLPFGKVSKTPTTSFCNWTMYKISELIDENNLITKLLFVHLSEKDLDKLNSYILS